MVLVAVALLFVGMAFTSCDTPRTSHETYYDAPARQ